MKSDGTSASSSNPLTLPLSQTEQTTLGECEAIIHKHLHSFLQVGAALMRIQRDRLYRAEYRSFQEYCRARWDFGRVHAHRLVKGAELVETVLTDLPDLPLPETERQVRPLTCLNSDQAKEAWTAAVRKSDGQKITARLVAQAARELSGSESSPKPRSPRETWQHLLLPLLKDALEQAQQGNRSAVEQILFKANLNLQIGADRKT